MIRAAVLASLALATLVPSALAEDESNSGWQHPVTSRSCWEIKGTEYLHPGERSFYWIVCLGKGQVGASPSPFSIEEVICSPEFTWDCNWALEVTWCESRWDSNAFNPAGPYVGWWQVWNGSTDPWENTRQAHQQFLQWQGPNAWRSISPWPTCGAVYP